MLTQQQLDAADQQYKQSFGDPAPRLQQQDAKKSGALKGASFFDSIDNPKPSPQQPADLHTGTNTSTLSPDASLSSPLFKAGSEAMQELKPIAERVHSGETSKVVGAMEAAGPAASIAGKTIYNAIPEGIKGTENTALSKLFSTQHPVLKMIADSPVGQMVKSAIAKGSDAVTKLTDTHPDAAALIKSAADLVGLYGATELGAQGLPGVVKAGSEISKPAIDVAGKMVKGVSSDAVEAASGAFKGGVKKAESVLKEVPESDLAFSKSKKDIVDPMVSKIKAAEKAGNVNDAHDTIKEELANHATNVVKSGKLAASERYDEGVKPIIEKYGHIKGDLTPIKNNLNWSNFTSVPQTEENKAILNAARESLKNKGDSVPDLIALNKQLGLDMMGYKQGTFGRKVFGELKENVATQLNTLTNKEMKTVNDEYSSFMKDYRQVKNIWGENVLRDTKQNYVSKLLDEGKGASRKALTKIEGLAKEKGKLPSNHVPVLDAVKAHQVAKKMASGKTIIKSIAKKALGAALPFAASAAGVNYEMRH